MLLKILTRWVGTAVLTGAMVCSLSPALAESGDSAAPAAPASPAVENEAGFMGARMGQGLERLLRTGDPQVPTSDEKQQQLDAEAGRLEAPLNVPDTTGNQAPAATSAAPLAAAPEANTWMPPGIQGVDVSSHQQNVDWSAAWNQGARFAYTKATEGTYYKNKYYNQQYNGAANAGMVRGAYHFAIPAVGSGAEEANFFVDNGGGWTPDGRTLPPLLDIEYNPYRELGNSCYNLNPGQMITWIRDFSNTVLSRTGRVPMIYSTTDWWRTCTGNTNAFANHPLHIASYAKVPGGLPNGWPAYTMWQYSSSGPFVGDSNVFNGSTADLDRFVRGGSAAETAISRAAAANPALGAPSSAVICGLRDGGCYRNYRGGAILWSAATGAQLSTKGGIRNAYQASGFENGSLGYPTSGQICGLKDGGCFQDFQGGAILWSAATGAQLSTKGGIRNAYQASGFENGSLGYPTSGQVCGLKNSGCYQNFQGGAILWSAATGAQLSPNGPLRTAYQAAGFENGTLGYPTSGQVCGIRNNGCYQNFQGGAILWSAATGAQLSPNGPVRTAYKTHGFENGGLGYPTSGQICGIRDNGCYQNYQGGAITWTKSAGAHPTAGQIRKKWQSTGFENGVLGYPVTDESCRSGKCTQSYQHGRIEWTPAGGAVVIRK